MLDQEKISELENEKEEFKIGLEKLEKSVNQHFEWEKKEKKFQKKIKGLEEEVKELKGKLGIERERRNKAEEEVKEWVKQVSDLRDLNQGLVKQNDEMLELLQKRKNQKGE